MTSALYDFNSRISSYTGLFFRVLLLELFLKLKVFKMLAYSAIISLFTCKLHSSVIICTTPFTPFSSSCEDISLPCHVYVASLARARAGAIEKHSGFALVVISVS